MFYRVEQLAIHLQLANGRKARRSWERRQGFSSPKRVSKSRSTSENFYELLLTVAVTAVAIAKDGRVVGMFPGSVLRATAKGSRRQFYP